LLRLKACICGDCVIFENNYSINISEKVKENFCYSLKKNSLKPIAFFSKETNLFYKLTPTRDWPTVSIGSVPMHKLRSAQQDSLNKISLLKPYGLVLDTCFGLGYSATLAAGAARKVITFEKDRNVLSIARINPFSQPALVSQKIELRRQDIALAITNLADGYFDCIIHDPPTFKLAPQLYTLNFYLELYRVIKHHGRLFHYCPLYKIKQGFDFPARIRKRLKEAGFKIIDFSLAAGGFLCKK
jgi:predicted methyltransferase